MGKRKKVVWIAFVIAILLVMALIAIVIYKKVAPSHVQANLNKLFDLKAGEEAVLIDDELQDEKAIKADGYTYVPADMASAYLDNRIFVDRLEGVLAYTTSQGVIQARENAASYTLGKDTKETQEPVLRKIDKTYYVSLSFIKEHSSNYIQEYSNPSRMVVMTDRDKTHTFAVLSKDTDLRTGPGKRYPYWVEVSEGAKVLVETKTKEENGYTAVTTEDGITGYVPTDRLTQKKEGTWEFDSEPESFKQQTAGTKTVCLGWHQVTTEQSSKAIYSGISSAGAMNVIAPTWFSLSDNEGNFTSLADSGYVAQAHGAGKKVWGLVDDFKKGIKLSQVLGSTTSRTKLINGLVGKAIQYDLDGINIDFEHVTKDNAAAYLEFLRELTIKAHINELVISVDNYTPAAHNAFYNIKEQGKVVDYVILMAYDEHYQGSEESGSVSSLEFVKNGVASMVASVPKERVVAALPFYTRLWKESKSKGGKPTSQAYGMSAAETILKSHDTTAKWDDTTGQYFAQYKDGGYTYKIWLEEETSLGKKMDEVAKQKVAGFAFWKLGCERPATWSTIQKYCK